MSLSNYQLYQSPTLNYRKLKNVNVIPMTKLRTLHKIIKIKKKTIRLFKKI
jgi:hypothetical protein